MQTEVYNAYWEFACKRQEIFFKRFKGLPAPWSDDLILSKYKFTNAYRVEDRVSQFLIREVIYNGKQYSPEDIIFRIILFKIFNKIETWKNLEKYVGDISFSNYKRSVYEKAFENIIISKQKLYSAAYIMPSGKTSFGFSQKYKNNLSLLEMIMSSNIASKIAKLKSLKELYELLLSYPTIGSFLAFQFAIDINYTEICDFSEMSFVVAGPGAKSGIEKCFATLNHNCEYYIRYVAERQEEEFDKRGLHFKSLFGRKLQLIDCQNLFCEIDKYSRIAYPSILSKNGRLKIKQNFIPNDSAIDYFFPPKWKLDIYKGE
ncbi:MAG: putative DNA base hypermodification protein [Eubacteriales bacterium]|nr:putative DNA base hypermodification protein [Eubacteriales bacterium]